MTTLATVVLNKQYQDGTDFDEAQLDAGFDSLVTYLNLKIQPNLLQLALDAYGSAYIFNDNGLASFTANLFDKQYGLKTYNGGDITIGTAADVAYASVDAVNAAINFTPERAGKYKVIFQFSHTVTVTAGGNGQVETSFRLTDAITGSPAINSGGFIDAEASAGRLVHPISLSYIFDWDTNPKTIVLQKYNRTMSNVVSNQVSATGTTGEISISVEKL